MLDLQDGLFIKYWMFVNGFLVLMDVQALALLSLHLWFRRKSLKFVHLVSLAILIMLLGQLIFRAAHWVFWHDVATTDSVSTLALRLLWLFHHPIVKAASLFNMVGLIMIFAVLTWNVRLLWLYASGIAALLSLLAVWMTG